MKRLTITAIAAAISLAFSAAAMANSMSKTEHKAAKNNIEAEYKAAKALCDPLQANAKDICMAEAKGKANVAMAELAARKHPGSDARYDLHIARAEAEYAVTREKCDDLSGSANAACVRETEAARTSARNEALKIVKNSKQQRTVEAKSALVSTQRR